MSLSDFSKAVALVSEGFCPLCERGLERDVRMVDRGGISIEARDAYCSKCEVQWILSFVIAPKSTPVLHTSRPLSGDEVRQLYDREKKPT